MCNCLWETLKCPGKVLCCCCECACNVLFGFICSAIVLLVVIGLIVYFTVFYHKDNGGSDNGQKMAQQLIADAPTTFRSLFRNMQ